jgi:ribosomal protein S27E
MTMERDQRIYEVFEAALRGDPAGRPALDELCAGDPALRAAVEWLLAQDEQANRDHFLTPPDPPGQGAGQGRPTPHGLRGLDVHIRCPHCRNPIALVGLPAGAVICPSCGSSFWLEPEATVPWSPRTGPRRLGRFELIEAGGRRRPRPGRAPGREGGRPRPEGFLEP